MIKKYSKYFLYVICVSVIVIFLLEDACQIYVRNFMPDLKERYDFAQRSNGPQEYPEIQAHQARFKASPYFGYTSSEGNNYGFHTKEDFPLPRKKNTFIIAILGGSVANHYANYIFNTSGYAEKIKSAIPALKDKDIHFMGLALPGYKQPQQFFVLSYFLDQIDMVIQMDGWNEVSVVSPNDLPSDFPMFIDTIFNKKLHDKLDSARWKKFFIEDLEENKFLRSSMTVFLFKNTLQSKMNQEVQEVTEKVSKPFGTFHKPNSENMPQLVSTWSRYIKMERDLLKGSNKKGFFFVQASQYNTNSKVFTPNETSVAINSARKQFAAPGFQLLRAEAKKINVYDLADVFKHEAGSIYIDDCCHVNPRGNELLANEILKVISKNYNN